MVEGIIYKYTSPSGKSYIGQTTNERHRINTWKCIKYRYAGPKINRARAKYGPNQFTYEVLHKKYYFTKEQATQDLDMWEIYYIGYYDTYRNGYNSTIGGLSNRGIKKSKQSIEKVRRANLGRKKSLEEIYKLRKALTGKKHSLAASASSKNKRRSSGRLRVIYQFNLNGQLIQSWRCASEAAELINISVSNILRAVKTLGRYKGFYWRDSNVFVPKIIKTSSKTVYQKSLDGNIIATYNSIREASESINKLPTLISRCLNGKRQSAYGFIWTF